MTNCLMRIEISILALSIFFVHGIAVAPINGCVRLCFSVCGESVHPKCIDTATIAFGCRNEPVEFFAEQKGQCPFAAHPSWGIEYTQPGYSPSQWPEDKDYRNCDNGQEPAVWDGAGNFNTLDECKIYVEQMEKSNLFGSLGLADAAQEDLHLRRLGGMSLRQDWGAGALSDGIAEQHLHNMAVLSKLAYAEEPSFLQSVKAWSCKLCTMLPSINEVEFATVNGKWNLQALMIYDSNEDTLIISYRGTQMYSIWNWQINLSAIMVAFRGGFVHSGFLKSMKQLHDAGVGNFLLRYSSSKVVFTGHSLGGAMATLAGRYYAGANGYPSVKAVVSFGAPRSMGWSLFESVYPVMLHRVVFNKDPVPHLPPEKILGKKWYRHESTEIYYTEGRYSGTVCSGGEDPECSNHVSFMTAAFHVGDHSKYQSEVPVIGASRGSNTPGVSVPKCASGGSRGDDGTCCTDNNCINGWIYGCTSTNGCECNDTWDGCYLK